MCGIVGYIGKKQAAPLLLNGLKRLEYRGYDSAGLATLHGGRIDLRRAVGRVHELEQRLDEQPLTGTLGIAHTRWATHGRPSERNAHPHLDASGRIALVHNGIIENHAAIRALLESKGIAFRSETDTESLVQLIGFLYRENGDILGSVRHALRDVQGTFGVAVLCSEAPEMLIAARRGSPLLVGLGEHELLLASDGSAIIEHTSEVVYLSDNEIVTLGPEGFEASTIDAEPVEKVIDTLEISLEQIELGEHAHYMHKEIHEQPQALRNATAGRINVK